MTNTAKNFNGIAYNQVPESSNKIHGDEVAKQYGFKGGLVPGVTLSAYLVQPAIEAWGDDWLTKGFAHIKILSPVYANEAFSVSVDGQEQHYNASLISNNINCAVAEVSVTDNLPLMPTLQRHPFIDDNYQPPHASRQVMEQFLDQGCPSTRFQWSAQHEMAKYFYDVGNMPDLLRPTEAGRGKANLSFLLGCANRHFAAVATMSPWVHLETKSQNFQSVELGTNLISEMEILDLFEKKGHQFADCEFNLFEETSGHCVCSIWQRAIYLMRGQ